MYVAHVVEGDTENFHPEKTIVNQDVATVGKRFLEVKVFQCYS